MPLTLPLMVCTFIPVPTINSLNVARLSAKTKVKTVLARGILFDDDAALETHSEIAMQRLINKFASVCENFDLTISLKKTNVSAQDVSETTNMQTR